MFFLLTRWRWPLPVWLTQIWFILVVFIGAFSLLCWQLTVVDVLDSTHRAAHLSGLSYALLVLFYVLVPVWVNFRYLNLLVYAQPGAALTHLEAKFTEADVLLPRPFKFVALHLLVELLAPLLSLLLMVGLTALEVTDNTILWGTAFFCTAGSGWVFTWLYARVCPHAYAWHVLQIVRNIEQGLARRNTTFSSHTQGLGIYRYTLNEQKEVCLEVEGNKLVAVKGLGLQLRLKNLELYKFDRNLNV